MRKPTIILYPNASIRLLVLYAIFSGASVAGVAAAAAPDSGIQEVTVNAATIDKTLDGKQTNNFAFVSANEIVDQEGRHFAPSDTAGYIARVKPEKKAAYVFWISDKSEVQVAKNVISIFSDYGATVFVIRDTKLDKSQANAPDEPKKQKTVIIVGQPNPHALSATDRVPDMADRPAILRPGKLPSRVRYQFQPDAVVVAAAASVTKLLLGAPPVRRVFESMTPTAG
jgi:hypothetical protein